jgi:hypothetical protein
VALTAGVRLVPKSDGTYRTVIRMMTLNAAIPARRFKLAHLPAMFASVGQGWWGGSCDIQDAFCHVRIADDSLKWTGLALRGRLWVMRGLPMGYTLSPWLFNRLMKVVVQALRREELFRGAYVSAFFDDIVVCAPTKEQAEACEARLYELLESLGFRMADHKRTGLSQKIVHLGVELDTAERRARLKSGKGAKIIALSRRTAERWARALGLSGATEVPVDTHELLSLVGKIMHAASVHPGLRIFARRLLWLQPGETFGALPTTTGVGWSEVAALRCVATELGRCEETGSRVARPAHVVELWTDASGVEGGGFGGYCPAFGWMTSGRWPEAEWDGEAYPVPLKELKAFSLVLNEWAERLRGRKVRARLDSQTTTALWRNGGARRKKKAYTEVLEDIVRTARLHDIEIVPPEWVPREENKIADALSKAHGVFLPSAERVSRFDSGWRHEDWACPDEWVAAGLRAAGRPSLTVDVFASRRSAKAPLWWAPLAAAGCQGVGADSAPQWARPDEVVWAAPPLRLAGLAVRLADQAAAKVLLIVPEWPDQWWWPIIRGSKRAVKQFGSWPAVEADGRGNSELSGNKKWRLIGLAWSD